MISVNQLLLIVSTQTSTVMELKIYLIVLSFDIILVSGKIYDRCELARELINLHQIPEEQVATWVCIANHESSFNTAAVGHLNGDSSGDHGLFQISDIYWCSPPGRGQACDASCDEFEDDDIEDDVQCIKRIYQEHEHLSGNGFNAWAVYPYHCKGDHVQKYIEGCFDDDANIVQDYKPITTTLRSRSHKPKKSRLHTPFSNIFLDGTISIKPIKPKLNEITPYSNSRSFSNIFLDGTVTIKPFDIELNKFATSETDKEIPFDKTKPITHLIKQNQLSQQRLTTSTSRPKLRTITNSYFKTNEYTTQLPFSTTVWPKDDLVYNHIERRNGQIYLVQEPYGSMKKILSQNSLRQDGQSKIPINPREFITSTIKTTPKSIPNYYNRNIFTTTKIPSTNSIWNYYFSTTTPKTIKTSLAKSTTFSTTRKPLSTSLTAIQPLTSTNSIWNYYYSTTTPKTTKYPTYKPSTTANSKWNYYFSTTTPRTIEKLQTRPSNTKSTDLNPFNTTIVSPKTSPSSNSLWNSYFSTARTDGKLTTTAKPIFNRYQFTTPKPRETILTTPKSLTTTSKFITKSIWDIYLSRTTDPFNKRSSSVKFPITTSNYDQNRLISTQKFAQSKSFTSKSTRNPLWDVYLKRTTQKTSTTVKPITNYNQHPSSILQKQNRPNFTYPRTQYFSSTTIYPSRTITTTPRSITRRLTRST